MNKQLCLPANRLFNNSNLVTPGGTAELYVTGTLTPAQFKDENGADAGHILTANGLGQLPNAWQDEATPFRLILKDGDGAEIDGGDIDPFYFGLVAGVDGAPGAGGGNAIIGLFDDVAAVSVTDDAAFTTGKASVGTGGARYDSPANATFERIGNLTSGSAVVTGLRTTADLTVGAAVTCNSGLTATTIASIDSATQITLAGTASSTRVGANLKFATPINSAFVAANPTFSYLDANDKGFILSRDQVVTPFLFGAVDDLSMTTDITTEIQAFFDFWIEYQPPQVNCSINGGISDQIVIGPAIDPASSVLRHMNGNIRLTHIAGTGALLECIVVQNMPLFAWNGWLRVSGIGGTTYSSRLDGVGISVKNCNRGCITGMRAEKFRWGGIVLSVANNNHFHCEHAWVFDCGSGHGTANSATSGLSANWSSPVNSGSNGSTSQYTTITVDTDMPDTVDTDIMDYMQNTETPINVRINGELYQVKSVDIVNHTIQVYPWIDSALSSGTLEYCFGGGVVTRSGDGMGLFDSIIATRCGRGACIASQYGAHLHGMIGTNCGTDIYIGREWGAAVVNGFWIEGYYTEGTTSTEHIVFGNAPSNAVSGYIDSEHNLLLSRCWMIDQPRDGSNVRTTTAVGIDGNPSAAFTLISKGRRYNFERPSNTGGADGTTTFRDHQFTHKVKTFNGINSRTITLGVVGSGEYNRLFGHRGAMWGYVGTGTNGAPTGTFTFTPPSGGTVNGGATNASAAFSGFHGPVYFEIYHTDTSQLTWIVRPVCGWRLIGSATQNWASIASLGTATTTVTVTGAALGDTFVPSMSIDEGGLMLRAYVSAADTVTVVAFNPTAGAIDLASGTLTVRQVK